MIPIKIAQEALDRDTLVLTPGATIDNTNVRQVASLLSESRSAGYKNVIMDLSQLEFLSSAGVGAIFSHVQKYRDAGGDIILCDVSEAILYVLTELDVAEHLTIASDRKAVEQTVGARG